MHQSEGILLVNKPEGLSSFAVVHKARKRLGVKKIGHAGTLDPFASGLIVLLIGRAFTKRSGEFLTCDKSYEARLLLGSATDSFDLTGTVTHQSDTIPTRLELEEALQAFQGPILQVPPMFSAKKVAGKRLYLLAREGKEIERQPVQVRVEIELISYNYPFVDILVHASKGTYIRSLAHDIGSRLGSFAHLVSLRRIRSGSFLLDRACSLELLQDPDSVLDPYFQR